MNNQIILEIKKLKKSFSGLDQPVLNNINLSIKSKEKIAITGVSGSGKSTLLHLMAGLEEPDSGYIKIVDKDLKTLKSDEISILRNKYLGFIYQFHHLLPDFSVIENIMMPFTIRGEVTKKNTLKLFYKSERRGDPSKLNAPDNICITPNGNLLVTEDPGGSWTNYLELWVINHRTRKSYPLLRVHNHNGSELTGGSFTKDGKRLYFSSQRGKDGNGITYEVKGDFSNI